MTLSSDKLGIIAKMDAIEEKEGVVCPIDHKKGEAADAGQIPPPLVDDPRCPIRRSEPVHRIYDEVRAMLVQYITLRDYGDPLQLSVFECQGPVEGRSAEALETMGLQYRPRDRSVTVV